MGSSVALAGAIPHTLKAGAGRGVRRSSAWPQGAGVLGSRHFGVKQRKRDQQAGVDFDNLDFRSRFQRGVVEVAEKDRAHLSERPKSCRTPPSQTCSLTLRGSSV